MGITKCPLQGDAAGSYVCWFTNSMKNRSHLPSTPVIVRSYKPTQPLCRGHHIAWKWMKMDHLVP